MENMKSETLVKSIYEDKTAHIDMTGQTIKLRDGRNLGYAQYGEPAGDAVFYFHGSPSSRLEAAAWHKTAKRLNIRIIAVDRPGMGLSTFQNGRRILDFPTDVCELADSLNIENFSVLGMSGGGPYVSACAYMLPHRVTVAGILSGTGPYNLGTSKGKMVFSIRSTDWISHNIPWLMRLVFALVINRVRRKRDLFFWKSLPESDKDVLDIPSIEDIWIESITEAFRFGTRGPVKDSVLLTQPWGINPEKISIPITIWHGQLDCIVPINAARYFADRIPNCNAHFYPHEGHFSLWLNHMEEVLKTMISVQYTSVNTYNLVKSR